MVYTQMGDARHACTLTRVHADGSYDWVSGDEVRLNVPGSVPLYDINGAAIQARAALEAQREEDKAALRARIAASGVLDDTREALARSEARWQALLDVLAGVPLLGSVIAAVRDIE